ncbi:MAG: type II/IV secretion system protein [Planctomycetota bacterium]|nr:MAG: type II/IV secretion system protein [Planctomycetota bacterium]
MAEAASAIPEDLAKINELDARGAVDVILRHAVQRRASDVFIQPNTNHYNVSIRELGRIRRLVVVSTPLGLQIINHIKSLSGMDLAEKRIPLDGHWGREVQGKRFEFRVNTIGTHYGEDLVMRLIPTGDDRLRLPDLGLEGRQLSDVKSMLNVGAGLLLVCGPVGSGKSTTLYACLDHLNTGERMINTLEDPIEQVLPGIRQSAIQNKIGVGFQELLRGVLRQSPDVIMIGEIRDEETADTAVRAANSGHLVLSTLHSPLAAGAIQSMLAFGINPYFFANCLVGIVAQRLVRQLSPESRIAYDVSHAPEMFDEVRDHLQPGQGKVIYGPDEGDPNSVGGYIGRTGLFEVMPAGKSIKDLISRGAEVGEIHRAAIERGMLDFRRAALLKLAQGVISVEEMSRVIPVAEWDDQEAV